MAYSKEWYEKYGHSYKKYYQKNKEILLSRSKKWMKEHPEEMKKIRANQYIKHKKKINKASREYTLKRKLIVLNYYSKNNLRCKNCFYDKVECLDIDHINNNGNIQRKETNTSGAGFYGWLIKNNYPEGYQILCRNCNWLKYIENLKNKYEKQ